MKKISMIKAVSLKELGMRKKGLLGCFLAAGLCFSHVTTCFGTTVTNAMKAPYLFAPKTMQIQTGDTVVWVNDDFIGHDTVSDEGLWSSGHLLGRGQTYAHTFPTAGVFNYHCTPHAQFGMVGTITVTAAVSLPAVTLTTPTNGATFTAPATVVLSANALETNGSIQRVEFNAASNIVAVATNAPYVANWTNVAAGTYIVTARAVDATGAAATSAPVTITVNPAVAAPIQLTSVTASATNLTLAWSGGAAPFVLQMIATITDTNWTTVLTTTNQQAVVGLTSTNAFFRVGGNAPAVQ